MMYKTHKLLIDSQELIIKPLKGKYFAKFMSAAGKMSGKETDKLSINDIGENEIAAFHELGVISLDTAYKDANIPKTLDEIEYIVTSNFKSVMEAVSLVNTPDN